MHYDTTNPQRGVEGATVPETPDAQDNTGGIAEAMEHEGDEPAEEDAIVPDESDEGHDADAKEEGSDESEDEDGTDDGA